jgi:hypothetical protein
MRDRIAVGFTTTYAIIAYHHNNVVSAHGEVYSIQHYDNVIKFVSPYHLCCSFALLKWAFSFLVEFKQKETIFSSLKLKKRNDKTKTINLKFSDINVCFVIKGLMVLLWLWYLTPLSTLC